MTPSPASSQIFVGPGEGDVVIYVTDGAFIASAATLSGLVVADQVENGGTDEALLYTNGIFGGLNMVAGAAILAVCLTDDDDDVGWLALGGVQLGVGAVAVLVSLFSSVQDPSVRAGPGPEGALSPFVAPQRDGFATGFTWTFSHW